MLGTLDVADAQLGPAAAHEGGLHVPLGTGVEEAQGVARGDVGQRLNCKSEGKEVGQPQLVSLSLTQRGQAASDPDKHAYKKYTGESTAGLFCPGKCGHILASARLRLRLFTRCLCVRYTKGLAPLSTNSLSKVSVL